MDNQTNPEQNCTPEQQPMPHQIDTPQTEETQTASILEHLAENSQCKSSASVQDVPCGSVETPYQNNEAQVCPEPGVCNSEPVAAQPVQPVPAEQPTQSAAPVAPVVATPVEDTVQTPHNACECGCSSQPQPVNQAQQQPYQAQPNFQAHQPYQAQQPYQGQQPYQAQQSYQAQQPYQGQPNYQAQQPYAQQPYQAQQPYPVNYGQQAMPAQKSHVAAGILAILFGGLGVHKFYLGYTRAGVIMLVCFLCGVFTGGISSIVMAIISFIEGIIYLTMNDQQFYQTYVLGKKEWF